MNDEPVRERSKVRIRPGLESIISGSAPGKKLTEVKRCGF
jgi:hypothetical protein